MKIIVYGKPVCPQCTATERALTNKGLDFEKADLTQLPEKLEEFKAAGFGSAPVVSINDVPQWCGFRPDLIGKLS